MTMELATNYKLPPSLAAYVDDGILEILSEKEDDKLSNSTFHHDGFSTHATTFRYIP